MTPRAGSGRDGVGRQPAQVGRAGAGPFSGDLPRVPPPSRGGGRQRLPGRRRRGRLCHPRRLLRVLPTGPVVDLAADLGALPGLVRGPGGDVAGGAALRPRRRLRDVAFTVVGVARLGGRAAPVVVALVARGIARPGLRPVLAPASARPWTTSPRSPSRSWQWMTDVRSLGRTLALAEACRTGPPRGGERALPDRPRPSRPARPLVHDHHGQSRSGPPAGASDPTRALREIHEVEKLARRPWPTSGRRCRATGR